MLLLRDLLNRKTVIRLRMRSNFAFVDKPSKQAPWIDVHQVADRNRGVVTQVVLDSFELAGKTASIADLMRAIKSNNREALQEMTDVILNAFEKSYLELMPPALTKVVKDSGTEAGKTAQAQGDYRTAQVILGFDRTNPFAAEWAALRSSMLITQINDASRLAIQRLINRAFIEGIPPRQLAMLIRNHHGLTAPFVDAVYRARIRLQEARGTTLLLGRTPVSIPAGGLSAELVELRFRQYARRLTNFRARMIARTETIAAANAGQQQLWEQAQNNGLLTGQELKEWIFTPDERSCVICQSMAGQQVPVRSLFELPSGGAIPSPPAHPMCRCSMGLTAGKKTVAKDPEIKKIGPPIASIPIPKPPSTIQDLNLSMAEIARGQTFMEHGLPFPQASQFGPGGVASASDPVKAYAKWQIEQDIAKQLLAQGVTKNEIIALMESKLSGFFGAPELSYTGFIKNPILDDIGNIIWKEVVIGEHEFFARRLTRQLVNGWAGTSGDANPSAIAIQLAVKAEFGLTSSALGHFEKNILAKATQLFESNQKVYKAFTRAMYNNTQARLKAEGINFVTLYRGVRTFDLEKAGIKGNEIVAMLDKIGLQPASSYSTSLDTALEFAHGQLIISRVPVNRILGTARSGFGCLSESEFVILGQEFESLNILGSEIGALSIEELREFESILAELFKSALKRQALQS